ncbi:hypothetical protein ACFYM2_07535 [Streptomyces sp. NPDC006711]|uniref:hypothetical protein n=1 Tax=unclassified Streptomyces TaxID=2593676 RepID=UPI0033D4D593
MLLWIVLIVLVLGLFGFGFTLHVLWYVAAALLVLWVIGSFTGGRTGSGRTPGHGPPATPYPPPARPRVRETGDLCRGTLPVPR